MSCRGGQCRGCSSCGNSNWGGGSGWSGGNSNWGGGSGWSGGNSNWGGGSGWSGGNSRGTNACSFPNFPQPINLPQYSVTVTPPNLTTFDGKKLRVTLNLTLLAGGFVNMEVQRFKARVRQSTQALDLGSGCFPANVVPAEPNQQPIMLRSGKRGCDRLAATFLVGNGGLWMEMFSQSGTGIFEEDMHFEVPTFRIVWKIDDC